LIAWFGLDRLCQLATEKDPGFSPTVLGDMLDGFHRFGPQDFELDESDWRRIARAVDEWRTQLRGQAVEYRRRGPDLGV
jgi:hypothetical protein